MILTIEINDTVLLILAIIGAISTATTLAHIAFRLDEPVRR